jgi:proteasome lid subunit RPN8/RPN11
VIGPDQSAQLLEWARAEATREACGFLFGIAGERGVEVRAVSRARNLAGMDDAFVLDPGDVVRAERDARASGLELVGFWHSHPHGAAMPSADDERAAWPGHLCVIVGLGGTPSIRAWRCVAGRLVESRLEA